MLAGFMGEMNVYGSELWAAFVAPGRKQREVHRWRGRRLVGDRERDREREEVLCMAACHLHDAEADAAVLKTLILEILPCKLYPTLFRSLSLFTSPVLSLSLSLPISLGSLRSRRIFARTRLPRCLRPFIVPFLSSGSVSGRASPVALR